MANLAWRFPPLENNAGFVHDINIYYIARDARCVEYAEHTGKDKLQLAFPVGQVFNGDSLRLGRLGHALLAGEYEYGTGDPQTAVRLVCDDAAVGHMAANRAFNVFAHVCGIEYLSAALNYIELAVCGLAVLLHAQNKSCRKHLILCRRAERAASERVKRSLGRCQQRI